MSPIFETISLKREELYEQVWTTPVARLAKSYGLSDVAIGKICKKHSIPKPPLGYWAKVSHGKILPRPPLPDVTGDRLNIIEIHKRSSRQDPADPASTDQAAEMSVPVRERLTSPHPLVGSSLAILKSRPTDQDGLIRPWAAQCLDVSVARANIGRAMRIMDALLKALDARGYSTTVVEKERKHLTRVQLLGEAVEIEIRELLVRREKQFTAAEKKEREKSSWLRDRMEYEYFPSGRLTFNILNYLADGCRRLWSDGKKQRLENCLGSIISGLIAAAESERTHRLQREQWEKERREREQAQLEEQERKRKEQEKVGRLEYLVDSWKKGQNIREFIAAIEKGYAERNQHIDLDSELATWLSWARRYADTIDPIVQTLDSTLKTKPDSGSES